MTHKVLFQPSALRELCRLPRDVQVRIVTRTQALSKNPRPEGAKKLAGMEELYRLRVGEYRVIYQIRDRELIVLVVRVRHRRNVYRKG